MAEDSAVYSCQLRLISNTTIEDLALNSTNFKLEVYPFIKGGLDPRSPKVAVKLAFLFSFIIFYLLVIKFSAIHLEFEFE